MIEVKTVTSEYLDRELYFCTDVNQQKHVSHIEHIYFYISVEANTLCIGVGLLKIR